jgi:hypothetical protein
MFVQMECTCLVPAAVLGFVCAHHCMQQTSHTESCIASHLAANFDYFSNAFVTWHSWQRWLQGILALHCVDV